MFFLIVCVYVKGACLCMFISGVGVYDACDL